MSTRDGNKYDYNVPTPGSKKDDGKLYVNTTKEDVEHFCSRNIIDKICETRFAQHIFLNKKPLIPIKSEENGGIEWTFSNRDTLGVRLIARALATKETSEIFQVF